MQEYVNKFRNIVSHFITQAFFCFVIIWLSGVILAKVLNLPQYLNWNIDPIILYKAYFSWFFSNFSKYGLFSHNYLILKIFFCLFLLPFIYALIILFNYEQIFSYEFFKKPENLHGDARWATQSDIKRAGLRSKEGMLLGTDNKGYYVAEGFQHSLLFAPTGSGKGVGFVLPNLLFWSHSCVVHDIKLENYELTSGWRAKQGQKCYVWEPSNPDGITHCYNPIDWVSDKPGQMVDDVQKISNLIMPERDFWNNEARSLFVAVTLYLIADPNKPQTFGEVTRTMRSDDVAYNLAVVLDTLGDVIHPVAYMNISAFLQKADKERSGVVSTMNSSLELWANPLIDAATAKSDFNFNMMKKEKTTVYVGLTPDNIQRLQKLMQVFYQQSTEFLSRKMPDLKEEPYGVLFLMDEFPTLGKMEQFKSGIAYFRGYRVRLFLIIQDTQQLKGTYEDAGMNSFLSNSTFRITFAANNVETATLISQLCGNKTVESQSVSKQKVTLKNPTGDGGSVSVSQAQRALLLPQEVLLLPRDEQIVLIESFPPIRSKKIFYYKDKFFTDRLLPPVDVPKQEPYDPRKKNVDNYEELDEDDLTIEDQNYDFIDEDEDK